MKVFPTTAIQEIVPDAPTYVQPFTRLAEQDRFGAHRVVDDPEEADIILFLDGHQHNRDLDLTAIRNHPLVRAHRNKSFIYNEQDQPWCAMPGLYAAMPKGSLNPRWQRACAYLTLPNPYVVFGQASGREPDLLFSFMGRRGNRTRDRILCLSHPRAYIADTSAVDFFRAPCKEMDRQKQQYAEIVARSRFVLCPRGAGPGSFRIFETMVGGRVPVILSDSLAPPRGPVWEDCAVFVKERDIDKIPAILEKREERFQQMALAARREWEQWFAPDVLFHRMTEELKDILESRRAPESVLGRKLNLRYLRLRLRAAVGVLRNTPPH